MDFVFVFVCVLLDEVILLILRNVGGVESDIAISSDGVLFAVHGNTFVRYVLFMIYFHSFSICVTFSPYEILLLCRYLLERQT
jgi:hypothetical protein